MNEPVKSNPAAACLHLLPVPTEPALPMGPGYTRIIAPRQNSKARGATNAEVDVPVRSFALSLRCWRPLALAAAYPLRPPDSVVLCVLLVLPPY